MQHRCRLSDSSAVPVMQTALLHCTATLRCCMKSVNERGSAVAVAMWHPNCWKKYIADSPTAPRVSTAIGLKLYDGPMAVDCCTLTSFGC